MTIQTNLKQTNANNFLICFFIAMGQVAFGYPASVISVTLGQPAFLEYMGLANAEGRVTGNLLNVEGATSGVFQAGAAVGTIATAIILDRYGRKACMYYNAVLGIFGGALICGATNISMFLAGRFFAGMSAFGFLVVTPVYTSELSPPHFRALFCGLNGVFIGTGYCLAAWMGVAFHFADKPATQWRGPLGLALIWPSLMILVTFLSPESPRWLLIRGRWEEAREVTYKLHATRDNSEFAEQEFNEMKLQAEIDSKLESSWLSMFTKPSYRKRVAIICWMCFIGQSTAVLVINNYGPTFYSALGYDTTQQLLLQAGWVSVAPPMCFVGGVLTDIVGRKPVILVGISGCCFWLIVEACAVKYFTPERQSLGKLGVAALYLFNAFYNPSMDDAANIYYAEVFPNHIRSKGVALTNLVLALADLVYLQVTPYAFANIGWKYFLVFIIISGIGVISLFFLLPESKGTPLEEMAAVWGDDPSEIAVLGQSPEAARRNSDAKSFEAGEMKEDIGEHKEV